MFSRSSALVRHALRVDASLYWSHLFRASVPALFLLTIVFNDHWKLNGDAPGLELFKWLTFYDHLFISLASATFFATAISEEREEQTLPLLQMAGVGPAAILFGKWAPRMATAGLLLLAQAPFALLCVTLGGVLWEQVVAAYVCLAAHLILVGGMALLCSVGSATTTQACLRTSVIVLGAHIVAWVISLSVLSGWPVGTVLLDSLAPFRLQSILAPAFSESPLSRQVIVNVCGGAVCLAVAWLAFDTLTRYEPALRRSIKAVDGTPRRRRARPPTGWPQVWFGMHYLAGGPFKLLLRGVLAVAGSLLVAVALHGFPWESQDVGAVLGACGAALLVCEGACLAANLYRPDIVQQNWGTLGLLPTRLGLLAYARLLGTLTGILPGLVTMLSGVVFLQETIAGAFERGVGGALLSFFSGVTVLGWHLTSYFSVRFLRVAWPLTILMAISACGVYGLITFTIAPSPTPVGVAIVAGSGLLGIFCSGLLHLAIGRILVERLAD